MIVESCIDNINDMLFAAFAHGGDAGGPYGSESEWMQKTIKDFLIKYNLTERYEYKECDRKNSNCRYFKVPQIVKKQNQQISYDWNT